MLAWGADSFLLSLLPMLAWGADSFLFKFAPLAGMGSKFFSFRFAPYQGFSLMSAIGHSPPKFPDVRDFSDLVGHIV